MKKATTTQELNSKLKAMAEYDGLKLHIPANSEYKPYWKMFDSDGLIRAEIPSDKLRYHKDIAWLWPVAKKVCEELISTGVSKGEMYSARYLAICGALTDFDIPILFENTHQSIVFLNSQKHKNGNTTNYKRQCASRL